MTSKNGSQANTEKAGIRRLVEQALSGQISLFAEGFEKLIESRVKKLVVDERERVAGMMFTESFSPMSEDFKDKRSSIYNKLYVVDPVLFQKEKPHMPETFQNATPAGITIDPMHEKDAVDITRKFHSIEIADS